MILTILEAPVSESNVRNLVDAFDRGSGTLPPMIREVFLLHQPGSDRWGVAAVWRSAEELAAYQASVDIPEGVKMFRAAGAEPTLSRYEVTRHASHDAGVGVGVE